MEDKEFKALIRLLDDTDPEVSHHVWEKLSAIGKEGISRLEQEWEVQDDPKIQARIEDLIHQIQVEGVTDELLRWRKGGGRDLLEGWITLTRFAFPEMDADTYRNEVNRLVNKTWLQTNHNLDIVAKLKVLNHILFAMEGYRPERKAMKMPKLNFINTLIDQKKGSPMSLGMLYLIICQKLEFPVSGVILPGYFVLYVNEGNREFYVDVFNGGIFFSRNDLRKFLEQIQAEDKPSFYKPTSHIYIVLEMIRVVISGYEQEDNEAKAAEFRQLLDDIDIHF